MRMKLTTTKTLEVNVPLRQVLAPVPKAGPWVMDVCPERDHMLVTIQVHAESESLMLPFTLHGCKFGPDDIPTIVSALLDLHAHQRPQPAGTEIRPFDEAAADRGLQAWTPALDKQDEKWRTSMPAGALVPLAFHAGWAAREQGVSG